MNGQRLDLKGLTCYYLAFAASAPGRRLFLLGLSFLILLSLYLIGQWQLPSAAIQISEDANINPHRPSGVEGAGVDIDSPANLPASLQFPPHYSDALKLSLTSSTPKLSDPWAPLSLSRCLFGMPSYYAPCAARRMPDVEYAEELIYPDFEIREPYFARSEHRLKWRTFAQTCPDYIPRATALESGWVQYRGQSGQNFVFHNVKYSVNFGLDSWSPKSCMAPQVETSSMQSLSDPPTANSTVIIAASPDSWSFQHFLDRVTHTLAQGRHLSSSLPHVLTGRRPHMRTVQELWAKMGYTEDHLLHSTSHVEASTLIFACRAVLIHPWLSLKSLESFGIYHQETSETRNKLVYMSRSAGGPTSNGGRKVVNEGEVLSGIKAFLDQRGRGEELVMFNHQNFGDVTELFSWFSETVIAVIGPHGGAMINHRWARPQTLVLEFMPTTRIATMIYEEAAILSQTYATLMIEPTSPGGTDMLVDVDDVVSLLDKHLGVVGEDPLRKSYFWRSPGLGF
ncbi:hypothetical protein R3P38DRAFT_3044665 [Favolaschia claudopus]|uniref:Glycosyltransferase 61 catalytic domain-containing protein n=1 Tax=Favolaschia claudopus TaxID=2862362 RepID=A0AAW0A6J9_9AGAR